MWYLITSTGTRLYMRPNKEVTFGRKKSDILLQNDESISRLHASIYVKPNEEIEADEPISTCELKDANSKYGTYIILNGEEKIEVTNAGIILKNGDKIRFGLQEHIFKVVYVPLITVVSTFQNSEKEKLQGILDEVDGMMTNNWTSACTHLTVSKAALTEKVTWAMASAVPIVNLNFWEAVKEATDSGSKLPNPAKFVPPISESFISRGCVSLCVNEKRKTLFQNFIFVHFSVRQYKIYGKMISMAGGKPIIYSRRPLTTKEVCAPNVVVIQYSESDTTQSTQGTVPEYETIYYALRESKRKMISETDIPLAILHCSTEKYCNPKYRFEELLKRPQLKPDSSKVLVVDTQDLTNDVRVPSKITSNVPVRTASNVKNSSQNVLIPESCSLTVSGSVASQSEDIMIISTSKASQDKKNTVNAMKYIPETKDSFDTQDLLITSTPKRSQDGKITVNSEISIKRVPVPKIKDVQKAVKYIPETKDSYDTQDLLRTGTLKASQGRENTVNTEVPVERVPAPKIKDVQKAVKYIPESKDLYDTQSILRTDTINPSQDAKSTSIQIQDTLRAGTSKESQNARVAINSDIPIERISIRRIKEVCLRKTVKYISESSDSSQPEETQRIKILNPNQIIKCTSKIDVSVDKISTQKVKEVNSHRPLKRALETNNSSDNIEGAQHSSQRSQCVRNKNSTLQEISRMKESMIANKGTPANDVIELLDEEDDDEEEENKLEEILLSRGRSNIHPNSVLSPEKLSKLVHDHSVRVKSPEVNSHCTPLSRADNSHSTKTVSQIEKESVTKLNKRNKSFDENDEDILTLTRKKLCSDNSVTAVPMTSSNTVTPSQAENHNNLLRINTSSLRASVNFKKFKKVYNKIPQERITLNDMYIWNMFNVQNL